MVYQLTKFHVQRVDMVINPPWNLPFLGAKGLTSPEQTATVEMVFSQPWTCTFLVAKGLTTPELMANCFEKRIVASKDQKSDLKCCHIKNTSKNTITTTSEAQIVKVEIVKFWAVLKQQQSPLRITSTPSLSQQPTPSSPSPEPIQPTHEAEETASIPHDSPLHDVHSYGSAEGSMQLHDLTVLFNKLNDKIDGLEKDLQQTKKTYSTTLTKLVLRVKKLEYKLKSGKVRRKAKIILSNDEEIAEDSSK
ncbi:hypothetical protein Tco_1209802 [Tanacetum coccineum]